MNYRKSTSGKNTFRPTQKFPRVRGDLAQFRYILAHLFPFFTGSPFRTISPQEPEGDDAKSAQGAILRSLGRFDAGGSEGHGSAFFALQVLRPPNHISPDAKIASGRNNLVLIRIILTRASLFFTGSLFRTISPQEPVVFWAIFGEKKKAPNRHFYKQNSRRRPAGLKKILT